MIMLRTVRLPSRLAVGRGRIFLTDRYRLPRLVAEDAEDGAARNAEARGQLSYWHARRALRNDLRITRLVEERAQATRLLVAAARQRATQAAWVHVAAVVPVSCELRQGV